MRVILYARTSADQEHNAHSMASQMEMLQDYATKKGYEVIDAYIEYGSGVIFNPHLVEAVAEIREGKADRLVVHNLDRVARSSALLQDIAKQIVLETCDGIQVGPQIDADKLLLTLSVQARELERKRLIERLQRGRQAKKELRAKQNEVTQANAS